MDNKNYAILISLGLAGMAIGIWSEISVLWTVEQNWEKLLSTTGTIAIVLYLLLLLSGLYFLRVGAWRVEALNRLARKLRLSSPARWVLVTALFFLYTYIYLFSVWQPVLAQPTPQIRSLLRSLAAVPNTDVHIVSGRRRRKNFARSTAPLAFRKPAPCVSES